jgi:hypothetical protein
MSFARACSGVGARRWKRRRRRCSGLFANDLARVKRQGRRDSPEGVSGVENRIFTTTPLPNRIIVPTTSVWVLLSRSLNIHRIDRFLFVAPQ